MAKLKAQTFPSDSRTARRIPNPANPAEEE